MPTADEFRQQLLEVFRLAHARRERSVVVKAKDLHQVVGDYPDPTRHRMPVCCDVMRRAMRRGDEILHEPPKGNGATLAIRYTIPQLKQGVGS